MSFLKTDRDWQSFQKLYGYLKPYRGWISVNLLVTLGSAAVDVAGGFFIRRITDATLNQDIAAIMAMLMPIAFVVFLGVLAKYGVKATAGRFTGAVVYDLRARVMEVIPKMAYPEIEKYHSGDIMSRLSNDIYGIQGFLQNSFSNLVYQPLVLAGVFIYLLSINWQLTLLALVMTMISLYCLARLSRPIGTYAREIQAGHGIVNAFAQETIAGIRIVKAFNLEAFFEDHFKKRVDQLFGSYLKKNKRSSILMPLIFFAELIPLICTMTLGSFLTWRGEMTLGGLFSFVYLLHYLSDPLNIIPELIQEFRTVAVSVNRLDELTRIAPERTDGRIFQPAEGGPVLQFKDVRFAYHETHDILKGLSFEIPTGSKTAIVGPSGGGKSTIFKLICGYYPVPEGEIALYGQPYPAWNLTGLRAQISMVTQDTFLFPGTILENLSYGRPGATGEELIRAAKIANAHEFIMAFPDGYRTVVGERGNLLSGGQKQRIALARAFLKDAPLLLLDEPTSALDSQSEALIMAALNRISRHKTVLIIAHRLSTIRMADQILVVDDGQVVERGTHDGLLGQQGRYHQLYRQQFAG